MGLEDDFGVQTRETMSLPHTIESDGCVYQDQYKKVEKITARFNGFSKEYFVSDYGQKAAVIVEKDNKILLARQYRLLINRVSYEIPGGRVNDGETPTDAAIRECFEETGVRCNNLVSLINYNPDLEYTRNYTYVFYSNSAEVEDDENQNVHTWLSLEECLRLVAKGEITDSLSIITLFARKLLDTK